MLSSPLRATQSFVLSEVTVTTFAKATASSIGVGIDTGAVDIDALIAYRNKKLFAVLSSRA